jgi:hypothetical protein
MVFFRHLNLGLLECRSTNNNATKAQSRILKIEINRKHNLPFCSVYKELHYIPRLNFNYLKKILNSICITVVPTSVKILNAPRMFQVDKNYRLVCLAEGSRPLPDITWKIGRSIVKSKVK